MPDDLLPTRPCLRAYTLDDMHIRSDGSGRGVEAYAAAFRTKTEVRDQEGHYDEELTTPSFDKTIREKGPSGFSVLFNHARTVDGAQNPAATMPIGAPLEARAGERGAY